MVDRASKRATGESAWVFSCAQTWRAALTITGGSWIYSSVSWNDWCRARDPEIWGPDAAEFKPARFLDEKGHLIKPDEWKYHVFNGGRRLCLGMNLALFEGSAVLAALAREFDFQFGKDYLATVPMCENDNTPLYRPSLTLPMVSCPSPVLAKTPLIQRVNCRPPRSWFARRGGTPLESLKDVGFCLSIIGCSKCLL